MCPLWLAFIWQTILGLLRINYYWLEAIALFFVPVSMRKLKNIAGDIALITGAGSGIGRLIALRMSRRGAKVVLWDVNKAALEETKKMIAVEGGNAWAYICNVADRKMVYNVADRVRRDVGHVTLLVNNAGVVTGTWFLDTPDEKITWTMDVNVNAHFWVCLCIYTLRRSAQLDSTVVRPNNINSTVL